MEASFFVNRDALQRIQPGMRHDEEGLLRAFDRHRDLIYKPPQRFTGADAKPFTN
jgi:hypothetical protein